MNRIVSTILLIVLLDLTIQNLDAWKIESSVGNGQKRMIQRRQKRDIPTLLPSPYNSGPCGDGLGCDQFATRNTQVGMQLQKTISYVQQRNFFLSGLVSLPALQNGGMCYPNTNFFTPDAFAAIVCGHMTLPQLSSLSLFPVQSVNVDGLLNAAYLTSYGQSHVLSPMGIQASLFGHITTSQLQGLNIFPLQNDMMSSEFLQQAGYLQSDCLPTALGLAASYIRYIPNNFASSGCQQNSDLSWSIDRLTNANYVYGASNVLTTIGLLAMHRGFITKDVFRNLGCYPFVSGVQSQTQTSEYAYQEQQQTQTQSTVIINDLVHAGYLNSNMLLTNVAYYAISKSYFTVDHFRRLNLWPCSGTPTINSFVTAGYASYSGHLTTLGYSLYHAQYFSVDLLSNIGIHLHDDFPIYHHALHYGQFLRSAYHETHTALHAAASSYQSYGFPSAMVPQYKSVVGASIPVNSDFGGDGSFPNQ